MAFETCWLLGGGERSRLKGERGLRKEAANLRSENVAGVLNIFKKGQCVFLKYMNYNYL